MSTSQRPLIAQVGESRCVANMRGRGTVRRLGIWQERSKERYRKKTSGERGGGPRTNAL